MQAGKVTIIKLYKTVPNHNKMGTVFISVLLILFSNTFIYFEENFIVKASSIHFIPTQMMSKLPTKLALSIEIKER